MVPAKPTFTLSNDSDGESSQPPSRSTSRERPAHPPPPLSSSASVRRYSHESGLHTPPSKQHLLCDLDEEAALEHTGETEALLGGAHGTPRRRLTGNSYGTNSTSFLALNENGGAPLHRQDSVLRVRDSARRALDCVDIC